MVSSIASPALLPAVPASVLKAMVGPAGSSVGAVVSITGSATLSMSGMLPVCTRLLPARSVIPPCRALFSAASSMASWPS